MASASFTHCLFNLLWCDVDAPERWFSLHKTNAANEELVIRLIDKDALWTRPGLSYQVHELKFSKQFSEGDFLDMIAKKRVLDFFQWLDEQRYYIHVANINIFYYGIVDIIDSIIEWDDLRILCNGADDMCAGKLFEIKEDLYQALHSHKDEVQTFLPNMSIPI